MKIIKKIKTTFKFLENCLAFPIAFPITIPTYIKRAIPILNSIIFLINLLTWYCFLLFVLGLAINKLGWSNTDTGWIAFISKNPYDLINNSFFGWSLIIIGSFYSLATLKNWWEVERLKKDLADWFVK